MSVQILSVIIVISMYIWPGPVRDQTSIQEFAGSILTPATYLW